MLFLFCIETRANRSFGTKLKQLESENKLQGSLIIWHWQRGFSIRCGSAAWRDLYCESHTSFPNRFSRTTCISIPRNASGFFHESFSSRVHAFFQTSFRTYSMLTTNGLFTLHARDWDRDRDRELDCHKRRQYRKCRKWSALPFYRTPPFSSTTTDFSQ